MSAMGARSGDVVARYDWSRIPRVVTALPEVHDARILRPVSPANHKVINSST